MEIRIALEDDHSITVYGESPAHGWTRIVTFQNEEELVKFIDRLMHFALSLRIPDVYRKALNKCPEQEIQ